MYQREDINVGKLLKRHSGFIPFLGYGDTVLRVKWSKKSRLIRLRAGLAFVVDDYIPACAMDAKVGSFFASTKCVRSCLWCS